MPNLTKQPDTTINHLALLHALKPKKEAKDRDTTVNHLALLRAIRFPKGKTTKSGTEPDIDID